MDNELRFWTHVWFPLKKCYSALNFLYQSAKVLSKDIKIMVCNALVLSHLNYANTVYCHCLDVANQLWLQQVQTSFLQCVGENITSAVSSWLVKHTKQATASFTMSELLAWWSTILIRYTRCSTILIRHTRCKRTFQTTPVNTKTQNGDVQMVLLVQHCKYVLWNK